MLNVILDGVCFDEKPINFVQITQPTQLSFPFVTFLATFSPWLFSLFLIVSFYSFIVKYFSEIIDRFLLGFITVLFKLLLIMVW